MLNTDSIRFTFDDLFGTLLVHLFLRRVGGHDSVEHVRFALFRQKKNTRFYIIFVTNLPLTEQILVPREISQTGLQVSLFSFMLFVKKTNNIKKNYKF